MKMNEKVSLPTLNKLQLDAIQIASPCNASWEQMEGDDRKRFCQQCRLHVYNVASMNRNEAEDFLRDELSSGNRVCVRLFRRSDGSILTRDCPVGVRAIRLRLVRGFAAMTAFLLGGVAMAASGTKLGQWARQQETQIVTGKLAPVAGAVSPAALGDVAMGGACAAPIQVTPIQVTPTQVTPLPVTQRPAPPNNP